MRLCLALLCFSLAAPALAADPYAEMEELTQVKDRYTIGPWQGALVGGANCQLVNTETLQGVEFSLSAARSNPSTTIQLGATFLHDTTLNSLQIKLDEAEPVAQPFSVHHSGLFYMPKPEQLKALAAARFVTYAIGRLDRATKQLTKVGQVSFDLRGFDRAYELFSACIDGQMPANLPNEPLEEGDPRTVAGAPNWDVIDLTFDGKPYSRLANLKDTGDFALGLWVHNRAQYVLNLTSYKDMPELDRIKAAQLTLDDKDKMVLPVATQPDGLLITLPLSGVQKIAKAGQLKIESGAIKAEFTITNFAAVAQAIQLKE